MNWMREFDNQFKLSRDEICYAGIIQILLRQTGEILERDQQGIFLHDTVSDGYFMSVNDPDVGIN